MSLELEATIYLGHDSDCETCGMSYNRLEYEFEPLTGTHRFQLAVGCYGGDHLETPDAAAARAFVEEAARRFPGSGLDELAECITALAR